MADNAVEPCKELRPLRMLRLSSYSGSILITLVDHLQGLCGGLLHTLKEVLLCP